jgi:hypothetical protein
LKENRDYQAKATMLQPTDVLVSRVIQFIREQESVGGNSSWIGFVEIAYIQINYTAYQRSENVGLKHRIE